jgi:membrane protein
MIKLDTAVLSRAWRFLDHDLWTADVPSRGAFVRFGLRLLRLVVVILRASQDRLINLEAMGLVYTTLLSLVPFLAVTFSVLKAFGAHLRLEPLLAQALEPLGAERWSLTGRIVDFLGAMHVGVLGAVGVAGLFYSVVSLIEKIEDALNRIWSVRRSRSLVRKFSDYLSILLVGPVLVLAAFAVIAAAESHWVVQRVLAFTHLGWTTVILARHVIPFLFLAAAFTFIYRALPYTRVALGAAAVGGMTAAVLWHLAGVAFAALVAGSASYTAIYSSFASLVLGLIWLHVAWLIVLIGGQVAFVHQHPSSYVTVRGPRSMPFRERVGLAALVAIARRHLADGPPYRADELAGTIGAPLVSVDELIDAFVASGVLVRAIEPEGIVLARAPARLGVVEVLHVIRGAAASVGLRGQIAEAVDALLERRDRAVEEALGGVTLAALADQAPAVEPGVADLSRYRVQPRAAGASP